MKKTVLLLAVLIICLGGLMIWGLSGYTDLISLIRNDSLSGKVMAFTALIGIFGVIMQLHHDGKLKEVEFIVNFNNNLLQVPSLMCVHEVCKKTRSDSTYKREAQLNTDDAYKYLDYFEPLFFLLNNNVIKPEKMYRLVAFRFFVVVCDKEVVEKVIVGYRPHFGCIEDMYDSLNGCRIKKNKPLDIKIKLLNDKKSSLDKNSPGFEWKIKKIDKKISRLSGKRLGIHKSLRETMDKNPTFNDLIAHYDLEEM